jgi:hypothetical protein
LVRSARQKLGIRATAMRAPPALQGIHSDG